MPSGSAYWERYWTQRSALKRAPLPRGGPRPRREPCTAGHSMRVPTN